MSRWLAGALKVRLPVPARFIAMFSFAAPEGEFTRRSPLLVAKCARRNVLSIALFPKPGGETSRWFRGSSGVALLARMLVYSHFKVRVYSPGCLSSRAVSGGGFGRCLRGSPGVALLAKRPAWPRPVSLLQKAGPLKASLLASPLPWSQCSSDP